MGSKIQGVPHKLTGCPFDSPYLRDVEEQHAEDAGQKVAEERVRFDDLELHPDIEDGLWSMG